MDGMSERIHRCSHADHRLGAHGERAAPDHIIRPHTVGARCVSMGTGDRWDGRIEWRTRPAQNVANG
jgi:hypothetical protein